MIHKIETQMLGSLALLILKFMLLELKLGDELIKQFNIFFNIV